MGFIYIVCFALRRRLDRHGRDNVSQIVVVQCERELFVIAVAHVGMEPWFFEDGDVARVNTKSDVS